MKRLVLMGLMILMAACSPKETQKKEAAKPNVFVGDTFLPSHQQGTPRSGGTIRVCMNPEPGSLNPQLDPLDSWGSKIGELLYSTLATPNAHTYKHEPALASSWEISEDKLTLTFKLRKDVRWHDGKTFSAKDVIFTFNKILAPTSKTIASRSYLEPVDSYERIDDYTVRFKLKRPYWLALDAIAEIAIYPEHLYREGDFNTHPNNRAPVGTGPYRFEHWKSGDEIVLRRNDDYFGTSAFLEKIILKYVPDSNIRIQMMRRGELDIVEKVTPEIWRQNVNDPQIAKDFFRIRHIPSGLQWIGWNENHPAFSDTRVRRAMTYLIDRDDIIKNLRYGLDDAAASWFYPGSKEYNRELKPLAYDPKKALRLLEEAGWIDHNGDGIRDKDGQRFAFTFIVPGSHGFYEQLATIVETDLKRVGIEVKVTYLEWAVYMERLRKHEFDACSLLWRLYPRNDPYQIWHSSEIGGGSNFISFNNAEADKLLEDARTIYDEEKRTQLYHRFSQILHEEQPYTLLFNRNHLSFISRKFGGLFSSARGLIRYEEIYQIHPDKPSTQKN